MAMDCYQGQNEHQKMVASSDLFLATKHCSLCFRWLTTNHRPAWHCNQSWVMSKFLVMTKFLFIDICDSHLLALTLSVAHTRKPQPIQTKLHRAEFGSVRKTTVSFRCCCYGHHELIISASHCHFWINVTKLSSSPSLAPHYSQGLYPTPKWSHPLKSRRLLLGLWSSHDIRKTSLKVTQAILELN